MASIPDMTFKVVHDRKGTASGPIMGEKARSIATFLTDQGVIPKHTVRFELSAGVDEIMRVNAEYLVFDEPEEKEAVDIK